MNFKLLGLKIAEINTTFSHSLLEIGAMVLEKGIYDDNNNNKSEQRII